MPKSTRIDSLEYGDRFTFHSGEGAQVHVFEGVELGRVIYSLEEDRDYVLKIDPDVHVYPVEREGASEYEVLDDVNIGDTPTHTVKFADGTLVSLYMAPSEGPSGSLVVLVDDTRRAVRVTLNTKAEVRLWAEPDDDD